MENGNSDHEYSDSEENKLKYVDKNYEVSIWIEDILENNTLVDPWRACVLPVISESECEEQSYDWENPRNDTILDEFEPNLIDNEHSIKYYPSENHENLLNFVKLENHVDEDSVSISLKDKNGDSYQKGLMPKQRKQSTDDFKDEDEKLTSAMTPAKRKLSKPDSEEIEGMTILFTLCTSVFRVQAVLDLIIKLRT